MSRVLACRVLSHELERLLPGSSLDYFEPLCHKLRSQKFVEYVESMLGDHKVLVCGDCGGLGDMARSSGVSIPTADDCIDLLLEDNQREPKTLYLTDGWLENLDQIFGLDGLPGEAKKSVLRTIFSPIRRVVYVSTEAAALKEERAQELASLLGCEFSTREGSLSGISGALKE